MKIKKNQKVRVIINNVTVIVRASDMREQNRVIQHAWDSLLNMRKDVDLKPVGLCTNGAGTQIQIDLLWD